jgi:hypothetical protein
MSERKQPPLSRKNRRRVAEHSASQILVQEINDLVELMGRVKEMSLEPQTPADLLDILEGIGRSCSRLVTMLKAESALGKGDEIGEAVREATQIALGERSLLQNSRGSEPEGEAAGAQVPDPGRQPPGIPLEQDLVGEPSAPAKLAKKGTRPPRQTAAGQKTKKKVKNETAE